MEIYIQVPKKLQTLLDICFRWAKENDMEFASDKCVVVIAEEKIELYMGNVLLPQLENTKYLLVYLLMHMDQTGTSMLKM
jgi:hypothetical protein